MLSPTGEYLVFAFEAIMNKDDVNIYTQVFVNICAHISWVYIRKKN